VVVHGSGGFHSFAVVVGETPKTVLLAGLEVEVVSGRVAYGMVRLVLPDLKALGALRPLAFRARKGGKGSSRRFSYEGGWYTFWDGEACLDDARHY
jgi:hypothetical protein